MPDEPPQVILAEFNTIPQNFLVEFDQDMLEVPTAGDNWFLRWQNTARTLTFQAWGNPRRLIFSQVIAGANFGANVVDYSPEFPDVSNSIGVPLQQFFGFPVDPNP